jgi:HSP20 family protein
MAITRYSYRNPWRELDQLTNRLSRLFEDGSDSEMPANAGAWLPAVSVEETENEMILTAELPGVKPENVDVQLENNILTIRGEKREERKEGDENRRYHLWERTYGAFHRSFTLPHTVRADDITADFKEGLLLVRMPKAPEARSRRIEVGRSHANELSGGSPEMNTGSMEQRAGGEVKTEK